MEICHYHHLIFDSNGSKEGALKFQLILADLMLQLLNQQVFQQHHIKLINSYSKFNDI